MNKRDGAEVIALRALGWIVGDATVLPLFLAAGGVELAALKSRAGDPVFLAGVLDFLLQEDAWIIAFCDAEGLPYTAPQAARQSLPGGAATHWT